MTSARAVLHITSAPGGGVDRYLRDIAASTPYCHLALHVGAAIDVIEDLGRGAFWPVRAGSDAVADILAGAIGLVHLHTVDEASRNRTQMIRARAAAPLVTTLHDVGFMHRDAFGAGEAHGHDAQWVSEVAAVVAASETVIAPSRFIGDLAREVMRSVDPLVIAPGIPDSVVTDQPLPEAFAAKRPRHVVAVVGAIGPHKGSALLTELGAGLATLEAALVVIGYTDAWLRGGWAAPGVFVHGPYVDAALPGLLATYAPRVVLFPNRMPESFSYTLSEVLAAGVPVVVPDEGALGERVRKTGAGWLLPPRFDSYAALALLARVLSPAGVAEWTEVKSHVVAQTDSVPDLDGMARGVAAVYARFGLPVASSALPADLTALAPLLAANLNGLVFRDELVHLCEALENSDAAMKAAAAEAAMQSQRSRELEAWAGKLQDAVDEARTWAAKLERDVSTLNGELAARVADVQELARLRAEVDRVTLENAAFHQLPSPVQRLLRRLARAKR